MLGETQADDQAPRDPYSVGIDGPPTSQAKGRGRALPVASRPHVRAIAVALAFVVASAGLSWLGRNNVMLTTAADEFHNLHIAYNLARHGVFHDAPAWTPDAGPYLQREPGHPLFVLLVLATVPSFPEVDADCVLDPRCAEGEPIRERWRQAERLVVAVAVGATFLATFALTASWPLALVAGVAALNLVFSNASGHALAGLFLLLHAVLAFRAWRRPRVTTATFAGLALGLCVLVEATFQYWLLGLAALCAVGVWREGGDRRRPLARASAAMLLAAFLPAGLWMARNHAAVGQFTVSGRQGEVLAIRAEYAHATWSEIGGMLAYHMPTSNIPVASKLKRQAMKWLRPRDFGWARIGGPYDASAGNRAGFYVRAGQAIWYPQSRERTTHSLVAGRADLLAPGWRERSRPERDLVLRRAATQLIRENWLRHLAVSVPMAFSGADFRCRRYSALSIKPLCIMSSILGRASIPVTLVLLVVAARRRDVALGLLALPPIYFFGVHALGAHFLPRLSVPIIPLLIVTTMFAANEYLRRRAGRKGRGSRGRGTGHPLPASLE